MVEATTPPNPADPGDKTRTVPDPSLLTIDSLRREITMLENLLSNMIEGQEALTRERFHRVDALMMTAEERRREQKDDTQAAVDAALDSQKEATAKMEASISSQLSSLRSQFDTSLAAVQTSVSDLKDRATVIESLKQGQVEQRVEQRAISAGAIAAIGIGVTLVLAALAIITFMATYSG